ncbi:ArsR/SmtB family transcription factor [Saccharospirillum alexandrii]|uniref:ArsR/SmtB family transcription factor n=1 Tax=Saccharospirillum alexandrii TaxID=2448477 RepID=UPI000FD8FA79|nr:metalloregulator ArsR/SmtB family transcription factor [Saccharospirillum alexandrii]
MTTLTLEQAAAQLAELGHPTRLGLYRLLVRAGHGGAPVAELQQQLDVPGSTLSHHLSRLVHVGLVKQVREGRVLRCFAQYDRLNTLIGYLMEECCTESSC